MTPDEKLARLFDSLLKTGIDVLVMDGHAVRHYGVDRNTNDFDLVTSLKTPKELKQRVSMTDWLTGTREAIVWRHQDFARFEIGRWRKGKNNWGMVVITY